MRVNAVVAMVAVMRVGTSAGNRVDTSAEVYNFGAIFYLIE